MNLNISLVADIFKYLIHSFYSKYICYLYINYMPSGIYFGLHYEGEVKLL